MQVGVGYRCWLAERGGGGEDRVVGQLYGAAVRVRERGRRIARGVQVSRPGRALLVHRPRVLLLARQPRHVRRPPVARPRLLSHLQQVRARRPGPAPSRSTVKPNIGLSLIHI